MTILVHPFHNDQIEREVHMFIKSFWMGLVLVAQRKQA